MVAINQGGCTSEVLTELFYCCGTQRYPVLILIMLTASTDQPFIKLNKRTGRRDLVKS